MRYLILLALLLCQHFFLSAQSKMDSMIRLLPSAPDTQKVRLLNEIGYEYWRQDPQKALEYANEALALSEKLALPAAKAKALNNIGTANYVQGNYDAARKTYHQALELWTQQGDKKGIAACWINIGLTYSGQGDYDNALANLLNGVRIYEELDEKKGMANAYTNIGMVYVDKGNDKKGIEYHLKAYDLFEKLGNKTGLAAALNNIGIVYDNEGDYKKALEYYERSLKLKEELGQKSAIANTLLNIGVAYYNLYDYKQSLEYCMKAKSICEEIGDRDGLIGVYKYIGANYFSMKQYDKAEAAYMEASALATELNSRHNLMLAYIDLARLKRETGDYRSAYGYLEKAYNYRDSVFSEESEQAIAELQTRFDTEKKEKQIELLTKDSELQEAKLRKRDTMIYSFIAGIVLLAALTFFISRSYIQKRRANELLVRQKEVIEQANGQLNTANIQIREKNKEITDSISYAKRIQEAILPPQAALASLLPESFIVYQPKDIVSGDFYWFTQKDNKVMIAAADCTGHGVPGALMSMIGNDKLHQVIMEQGITDPGAALKELDRRLISVLNQDEASATKDGMDIALLSIDRASNTVTFAGANRPLYLFTGADLVEMKGTKLPVAGGIYGNKQFVSNTFTASKNDTLYIFSDGYADQFGGQSGKKFTTKGFKKMLAGIQSLPMQEQAKEIRKIFTEWRENKEQVDDVLVIGIRL